MTDAAIRVEDLWEGYSAKTRRGWRGRDLQWALRGINFDVGRGEMLGVIGPNGAGKTTLLQCLAGVLKPTRGSVTVQRPIASLTDLAAGFHRELTGKENVFIVSVLSGLSRRAARDLNDEIVGFSGIDRDKLQSPLRTYSAGMTLRLGFSVAVHVEPAVLLVDEVLAVGDEEFHQKCLAKVADLRARGSAVVLVSHDLEFVRAECDRCSVLNQGEMKFIGRPTEAVERYVQETGGTIQPQDFSPAAIYGRRGPRRTRPT